MKRALVMGGMRSGKTRRAMNLVMEASPRRLYVATGRAFDEEMSERIIAHRAERDASWRTVEEPLDISAVPAAPGEATLIDCLTLWLLNLQEAGLDIGTETNHLTDRIADWPGELVIVSGEVGLGIVPANAMARRFADDLGRVNQAVAHVCDRVELVIAGVPLVVKGA